jgi:hypothetical protein
LTAGLSTRRLALGPGRSGTRRCARATAAAAFQLGQAQTQHANLLESLLELALQFGDACVAGVDRVHRSGEIILGDPCRSPRERVHPRRWGISEALRVNLGDGITVVAPSNAPTNLNCDFFDIVPWDPATDRWFFASFETPFAEFVRGGSPPPGTRSAIISLPLNQIPVPLPEGRLGDTVSLFQLRRRQGAALNYSSIIAGSTVPAPDMVPGRSDTVAMPFSAPTDGGVDLELDVPSLVEVARAVRPTPAPVIRIVFGINAVRWHRQAGRVGRGFFRNLSEVVVVTAEPILPAAGRLTERVEWAPVVPAQDLVADARPARSA